MDSITRRINKIAALMDRHTVNKEIQDCYIEALNLSPSVDAVWDHALAEAHRLSTYHERQFKKLELEKVHLLAAQEHERSRTLNSEPLKQEENTMTDEQTTVETVEAAEGQDAPQVETSEPAGTATESTPSKDSAPVEAG